MGVWLGRSSFHTRAVQEKLGKLFESDAASQVGLPMMGRKVQDITERLGSVFGLLVSSVPLLQVKPRVCSRAHL
eukprot:2407035-Amphidinium_carterae.3